MKLTQIEDGARIILDANIFIYANKNQSSECSDLLLRCSLNKVNGYITTHVLAEIMHVLMVSEARETYEIFAKNTVKQLSEKKEKVRGFYKYADHISSILKSGITVEEIKSSDFTSVLHIQRQYGLLTNDALIVAAAQRLGIRAIASADKCFSDIYGIEHYIPGDLS